VERSVRIRPNRVVVATRMAVRVATRKITGPMPAAAANVAAQLTPPSGEAAEVAVRVYLARDAVRTATRTVDLMMSHPLAVYCLLPLLRMHAHVRLPRHGNYT
jgi:ribosomal protein S28E/S33